MYDRILLRYVGDGAALIGVPARDIRASDVGQFKLDFQVLLKSGLYEEVARPVETKVATPRSEKKEK